MSRPVNMQLLDGAWCSEKAWFIGLVWGDGNVYRKKGNHRVTFVCNIDTVQKWKDLICPTAGHQVKGENCWSAYVDSKALVSWFADRGIVGEKSTNLFWPEWLPKEYYVDFLRGLWDTDGCVTIEDREHRNGNGYNTLYVSFCAKNMVFARRVRDEISAATDEGPSALSACRSMNKAGDEELVTYQFKHTGAPAVQVCEYLYDNAPEHIRGESRYQMYRNYVAIVSSRICSCGAKAWSDVLCRDCWWKDWRVSNPNVACSCGTPSVAHGMCLACYKRARHREDTGNILCSCGNELKRGRWCEECIASGIADAARDSRRKENRDRYNSRIAGDKVVVKCGFCNEGHEVRRQSYDRNIAKNGKYICEKMGGHIAGSLPKDHLKKTNPYAAEGKKQCSKCAAILTTDMFDKRGPSWDGLASRCKKCISEINKAQYQAKIANKSTCGTAEAPIPVETVVTVVEEVLPSNAVPVAEVEAEVVAEEVSVEDAATEDIDPDLARRRAIARAKTARYRQRHPANRIDVFCDYCNETHNIRQITYDHSVEKFGKYLCKSASCSIAGKNPKIELRSVNPYAAEGKKQCALCKQVLPFDSFQKRNASSDGLHRYCRACRSAQRVEKAL